jgi:hypothetical protein
MAAQCTVYIDEFVQCRDVTFCCATMEALWDEIFYIDCANGKVCVEVVADIGEEWESRRALHAEFCWSCGAVIETVDVRSSDYPEDDADE